MFRALTRQCIITTIKKQLQPPILGCAILSGRMSAILVGATVYDNLEKEAVIKVLDEGWLGVGKYAKEFEDKVAKYVGHKYGIVTNSGSSALLLAVQSLELPKGSKVIVCACGFPATVSPIIHAGLIPIYVDAEMTSYSIDPHEIAKATMQHDAKAVVFAHTVGNVANMDKVMAIAKLHNLLVIEDICDALGAMWGKKQVGSFGDISCVSFYPSHHITAGGLGGMMLTSNDDYATRAISLRDWGKTHNSPTYYDAYTTDERNFVMVDSISYDYRYTYSHIGYNLKPADLNCAFGIAQMDKLDSFIEKRNANYQKLFDLFNRSPYFVMPKHHKEATPSWFNYPVVVKENTIFTRDQLVKYFEKHEIRCRLFFAGNITRQPAFKGTGIILGDLPVSDLLMKQAFLIACHPALTDDNILHIGKVLDNFLHEKDIN